ncbi:MULTISPECIES: WbqC family protein [Olivibacter]|uniref:WbqC family protein n=1 Tax=Olivibacter oleidegradans TaxID=760123 RepID=A0ABV6HM08_9SPHI|nr:MULTISPECIES: WbqC family protein [Olivibacter]MDM8175021.1 WbqC family protein [Olivibacter sp. 47]QEL01801.1 WbqC family protein [Olivibacter sp. LS-1]
MEKTDKLFPCFYLAPIAAVSEMLSADGDEILVEKFEHFPKQTYRNRASIYSPNGKLDLIIPVRKGAKVHTVMKDVRISYESDWQRLHWMSLQTSYRRSAYFEFYEDDFAPFYEKKYEFLFDFNTDLTSMLLRLLKIRKALTFTTSYLDNDAGIQDFRNRIHPKQTYQAKEFKPYFQVFEPKHGFLPNLSIVDLLFNQGPNSLNFL